jgi:hypothetical protein
MGERGAYTFHRTVASPTLTFLLLLLRMYSTWLALAQQNNSPFKSCYNFCHGTARFLTIHTRMTLMAAQHGRPWAALTGCATGRSTKHDWELHNDPVPRILQPIVRLEVLQVCRAVVDRDNNGHLVQVFLTRARSRCNVVLVHAEEPRKRNIVLRTCDFASCVSFHGFRPHFAYLGLRRTPVLTLKSLYTLRTYDSEGWSPCRLTRLGTMSFHSISRTSRITMSFFWFRKSNDRGCTMHCRTGIAAPKR